MENQIILKIFESNKTKQPKQDRQIWLLSPKISIKCNKIQQNPSNINIHVFKLCNGWGHKKTVPFFLLWQKTTFSMHTTVQSET
jgi:hypothetical protein